MPRYATFRGNADRLPYPCARKNQLPQLPQRRVCHLAEALQTGPFHREVPSRRLRQTTAIPARVAAETSLMSDAERAFPRLPWLVFRTKLGRTAPSIEAASHSSMQKAMPFGVKPYAFCDKTLCLSGQNPIPFGARPYTFASGAEIVHRPDSIWQVSTCHRRRAWPPRLRSAPPRRRARGFRPRPCRTPCLRYSPP